MIKFHAFLSIFVINAFLAVHKIDGFHEHILDFKPILKHSPPKWSSFVVFCNFV